MRIQKWAFMAVAGVILAGSVQAASYDIDGAHSRVGFKIRHLVSKVNGQFDSYAGTINYDEKSPESLTAQVTIKTASVNTAVQKRDDHLRSKDFFNVEKFPEMTFKSTKAKSTGPGQLQLTGDLTLLGVTKPVTLDVELGGVAKDPWGGTRAGFSAKGKLDRKDYGMVFNMGDKGGLVIGDEVEIVIEVEGVQKK